MKHQMKKSEMASRWRMLTLAQFSTVLPLLACLAAPLLPLAAQEETPVPPPAATPRSVAVTASRPGAFSAAAAEGQQEVVRAPMLLVRFCDEVGLGATEFEQFRDEASRLLRVAGIESIWVQCRVADGASNPAGCRELLKDNEIVIKLSPSAPKGSNKAMGASMISRDGVNVYATMYFSRVQNVAQACRVETTRLLAIAVIHEIGHLLGGPAHLRWGVMQGYWAPAQIVDLLGGGMLFPEQHARRLRANLLARSVEIVAKAK